MVADALIYHPVISHYQKFVATTSKCSCVDIYYSHTIIAHRVYTPNIQQ
jgi:hypothetical protein